MLMPVIINGFKNLQKSKVIQGSYCNKWLKN